MLNSNNTFVTDQNLKDLVKNLNNKNTEQAVLIYNDINKNTSDLNYEIDRAQRKEAELTDRVDEINLDSITRNNQLEDKFDDLIRKLESNHRNDKQQLQASIDEEKLARQLGLSQHYQTLSASISSLDKALTDSNDGAIAKQINLLRGQLITYTDNSDQNINIRLDREIASRNTFESSYNQFVESINDRVTAEIRGVNTTIDSHISQFSELSVAMSEHIQDKDNPHGITPEAIGAASIDLVTDISSKVDENTSSTVKNSGDQRLTGNLILAKDATQIGGNLTIEGDLVVNGATITQNRETQLLEDNFLLLNSAASNSTSPAGLAVRLTENSAAGIVYDPVKNDFFVGEGTIAVDGQFNFNQDQDKKILTVKDDLTDRHLLIWDASSNSVVDGGTYSEESLSDLFASWEAHNNLSTSVDQNSAAILNIQDLKQNKEDQNLNTQAKKLVDAINELKANHEDHVTKSNNPHTVTWYQLVDQGNVFTGQQPAMNGLASPGVSDQAARQYHVHPSDTNRAPINHASGSGQYGVATYSEYGHVKFDLEINAESENPVPGKVINNYVNQALASLETEQLSLDKSQTISNIKQTAGVLEIQCQPIEIQKSQVIGLEASLDSINEAINDIDLSSKDRANTLSADLAETNNRVSQIISDNQSLAEELKELIQEEALTRSTADQSIANNVETRLLSVNATLEQTNTRLSEVASIVDGFKDILNSFESLVSKINAGTVDPNQNFVLTFRKNEDSDSWNAKFIGMNEGELV